MLQLYCYWILEQKNRVHITDIHIHIFRKVYTYIFFIIASFCIFFILKPRRKKDFFFIFFFFFVNLHLSPPSQCRKIFYYFSSLLSHSLVWIANTAQKKKINIFHSNKHLLLYMKRRKDRDRNKKKIERGREGERNIKKNYITFFTKSQMWWNIKVYILNLSFAFTFYFCCSRQIDR